MQKKNEAVFILTGNIVLIVVSHGFVCVKENVRGGCLLDRCVVSNKLDFV